MAFSYSRTVTIDYTKCGTANSTNFPILVSGTYDGSGGTADLRTTGNGGKVINGSGYDIGFYSDATLTTKLSWETELYTASTGEVRYWVKIPTLSASANTVIYLAYGNGAITTDQSAATTTWDSNYKGVWHLQSMGTGAGAITDSTSNANHGTLTNTPTSTTGQIGNGGSFTAGSSQYMSGANGVTGAGTFAWETWVKVPSNPSSQGHVVGLMQGNGSSTFDHTLGITTAGQVKNYLWDGAVKNATSTGTVGTGWNHICTVADGTNFIIYLNGVQDGSVGTSGSTATSYTAPCFFIGGQPQNNWFYITMTIDEVRFSLGSRSSSWIKASYNSQSSPSTFYTLGSEVVMPKPGGTMGLMGVG
ncbi:MAG TPA: DUF2341 domain-containing protein [Candidatus Saccharimonadales bacterium]|nr:DUF2341 domain-containing protein [Candidatus Saccharimonadales bacterium]